MEIPVIMCGLLAVTTLLPMIPSQLGPYLQDVFSIFARFTSRSVEKPGVIPDVYQLHLQVAVHALFHRLYGMYPHNFMEFLRSHYRNKLKEFNEAILPMLERVRVHPLLVVGSPESETDKARWRKMEVHDVLTECARLALDTTEATQEEISLTSFPMTVTQQVEQRRGSKARVLLEHIGRTSSPIVPSTGGTPSGSEQNTPYMERKHAVPPKIDPVSGSLVSSQDPAALSSFWSPSITCPLSTPPSSRPPSPSASQLDISITSMPHHYPVSQTDTPLTTPRDSPYPDSARYSGVYSDISTPSKYSSGSKSSLHKKGVTPAPSSTGYIPQMHSAPNTPGYMDTSGSLFRFPSGGTPSRGLPAMGQKKRPKSMGPMELPKGHLESGKQPCHEIVKKLDDSKQKDHSKTDDGDVGLEKSKDERSSSSVSIKDLPNVMKEFSQREEDGINEEVLSLVGSPFPDSGFDQLAKDASSNGDAKQPLTLQHSWPGVTSTPENEQHTVQTTQPMSRSVDRRRDCVFSLANLEASDKNSLLSSYDGPIANILANESTESTSSGGSMDKPPRDERSASASTSGVHSIASSSSKNQGNNVLSSEHSQSFRPIHDRSLESPFTMVSTRSTMSDQSFTASGQMSDASLPMPYMHLYHDILPGCQKTVSAPGMGQSPGVSSLHSFGTPVSQTKRDSLLFSLSADSSSSMPFYALLSPSEILDRHIELGGAVHSKVLSRLPLTSQDSVDWTHFGGDPPADEINILRDQLVLLHTQLLYERHKREVHAERNRRLLGKTHKAKAYEELNRSMRDQLEIQNKEMNQITATLKLLQQQNRQLQEDIASKDREQHTLWQKLHTENETVKEANQELQKLLVEHRNEVDLARKDCQHANAELFSAKKELDNVQHDVSTNRHLKDEISRLNRELLLMGEANEKYHEQVERLAPSNCGMEKDELILAATKKELAGCRENLKTKTLLLDAAKCRITELEATITQKDTAMTDQKRFLENVKSLSKGKLEALESKYASLAKANQRLEAHILKLNKKLNEKNIREHHSRRTHSKPIDHSGGHSRADRHHRHSNHQRRKSNSESAAGGGSHAKSGASAQSIKVKSSRGQDESRDDKSPSRRHKEVPYGEDIAKLITEDDDNKSDRSTPSGIISQEASPRLGKITLLEESSLSSDWAHLSSELIAAGRSEVPDKTFGSPSHFVASHEKSSGSPVRFSESSLFRRVSRDSDSSSPKRGSSTDGMQPSPLSSAGSRSPRRSPRNWKADK
ncbi:hamartin-like isoform X1 [Amphiura filiformis]|uniref:hamartin-like isoform X1 n=1 Tax=Amphiura filiformis TaxID=82378 RepID=UPI003B218683